MAKYCIKMSCGHEETMELLGKNSERERKIEYFENYGKCKECYKLEMREKEQKEGLIFNVSVLPYINDKDGSILLSIYFTGNSYSCKDEIKKLGYKWTEKDEASDYFTIKKASMAWNKIISFDKLEEEIKKAESIGAKKTNTDESLYAMINYKIALDAQKRWNASR